MFEFENKVVLITGAAGGIGLAAAKAFAKQKAKVVLVDINGDKVAVEAKNICDAGGEATSIAADITVFPQCEAMVAHAVNTYGGLHITFNNAGMPTGISDSFEDYSLEEWDRVMAVNVTGMFHSMKAAVPALKSSGGNVIINTASVTCFTSSAGMLAYTASKHAVAGLTKAASMDLIKDGIRVNAVCPGLIDTPMLAGHMAIPEVKETLNAQPPIGRVGLPEEIAEAVLFLASDKSSYMVGELMRVDGGLSLN
ncbi:SDR family NAD(P)-dependent oxidoreductase [Paraglaciecola chathamensis]|uniref:3-oxoacyl-(Acyl-carrier-protein) reductase n=1 Tax=Paraglaciecola agarilytica NO2 TaxID=1125747 RepID=A0ABQ0I360_9ALTE|nr:SDR family NAD(P)-dependent oxidoreductase [Paraglaciecola agarilytica]GAC03753.1 3-oxoacyl-(acyl-carrier-protein) reductase [Paraglaciecola agarilytica NO2]